ncbi:MAG: class I SAM-dependent methyltransferase [Rikenellaceae bacterium]
MSKLATAERVSTELSDNFVFQRSLLAYYAAAQRVNGEVLEIGTGSGYGVEVIAPKATRFVTIDKHAPALEVVSPPNVEFREATVPPLPFADESFDCVISFQVIEHIKDDKRFVEEVRRVLRPGGRFIVSTPNIKMSLTRNPWHVREYTPEELRSLLVAQFQSVEELGVAGDEKIMEYYRKNREGVEKITRFDIFDLQHRLPRWVLQIPYDILNRLNRRKLLKDNNSLTASITMDNYVLKPVSAEASFDLFYIATKKIVK